MMTFVSAVTRSTFYLARSRARSSNLRGHVFKRQSTLTGIALSEFERFAPFRTAQASLNGIAHQLGFDGGQVVA